MALREFYRKLSYRKKIFTGMIVVAVVPTILCFIGVLVSFKAANEKRLQNDAESVLASSAEVLSDNLDRISEAVESLANAPAAKRMFETDDTDDMYDVYRLLYATNTRLGNYADFAVYDANGTLKLFTGNLSYIKKNISLNWGILYEITKKPTEACIRNARIYNGEDKTVFLRIGNAILSDDNEILGFVIADISGDKFGAILHSLNISQFGALYIYDDFGERVFTSSLIDETSLTSVEARVLNSRAKEKYIPSTDKAYRFYYGFDESHDLHLVFRQKVEPFNVMTRSLTIIVPAAVFFGLIMGLVISKSMSSMFYRPISRMSNGIEEIKKGNFDVKIKVDSEDELGQLSDSFNEMGERILYNMNELIDREKQLSKANIKMMQAQLNPHFIYNTLDTMKWIAKDNAIPEIATLSSGLADIMRASISSGQTVKLKKEIELVESYVEIQKIRFDDKFVFITDIPEELLECEVPKLILQPIVENAIIHGLKDRSFGQVLVQATNMEGKLVILVRDDGAGMDAETIRKLNAHEQLATGSNIGFHNVDSIIRLHYGQEYGLKVVSGPNEGAEIQYTLPIKIGN